MVIKRKDQERKLAKKLLKPRKNKNAKKHKRRRNKFEKDFENNGFANVNKPKRKKKGKRSRNKRKHKNQQELEKESNILEITTAKSKNHVVLNRNNVTLEILINKLNQNPELNYDRLVSSLRPDEKRKMRTFLEIVSHQNGTNCTKCVENKESEKVSSTSIEHSTRSVIFLSNSTITPINSNYLGSLKTTTPPPMTTTIKHVANQTLHRNIYDLDGGLESIFSGRNKPTYNNQLSKCDKRKNGCAHICNENDPDKCACLKGFILATDGKNCLGK